MKLIAQNIKGHYKEVILGPIFKLFEAVLELLVPLIMADIIDVGVLNGDMPYILRRALLLVLLAALGVAAAMVCQYYAAVAGGAFGRNLRSRLYAHIMRLSPAETAQIGTGGLITRLTNDTNQMQAGLNMLIRLGTRAPFLAVGSIVMALMLNARIGLIFLCTTPLVVLVLYFIMKYTVPKYGQIQQKQDNLSSLSGENLDGIRVIRAFSRQKQEQQEYESAAGDLSSLMVRVGKISAALNPVTNIIVSGAIACIVWFGAGFVLQGTARPGEIIALVSYMNQTLLALVAAANLMVLFTRAVASGKRVAQVLSVQPSIVDGPGADEDPLAAAVEFNGVDFAYHKGADNALSNITFRAARGQTIGVIGGTGSGKTTLVNLLVRSYDATSGQIRVNGDDVRQYSLQAMRQKIGLVPQDAALFSGTVRRNLAIGKPDATDEEMWHALSMAQADDFVKRMPNGLDSHIEEGGNNLSGGQKQRLTIARALVRTPQILILDDASSALDYATDARLRYALRNEKRDWTIFIVSQRAAAIKDADFILVLDDGALVGCGTHDNLLESSEIYHEICASQGLLEEVTL